MKSVKVTNPKFLEVLTFLAKKNCRKVGTHNLPIISNVRATDKGFTLNVRMYNNTKKKFDKLTDVKFADAEVIKVIEFQMNFRTNEEEGMMRKDFTPKVEKVNMKSYKAAKFNTPVKKPKAKAGDFNVIVMDDNGTSSGQMDIGGVHELLSKIL